MSDFIIKILNLVLGFLLIASICIANDAIRSLPYAMWTKSNGKVGVTIHKKDKCSDSLILWNSRNKSTGWLMDREGEIIHSWHIESDPWHYCELYKDHLYAIIKDKFLVKLDNDSRVIWRTKIRAHHDLDFDDSTVYVLTRKGNSVDYVSMILPITGKVIKEYRLADILVSHFPDVDFVANDPLHTNSIQLLENGDILTSFRELDTIAIINLEQQKLVWKWGQGILSKQHHPTMLQNGNILIFDNGRQNKKSRVF